MKNVLLVLLPALLQAQELKQLAGFAFRTNPHQKAILDLDLEKMRTVMRDGNMAEFRDSQEVYEFGAHSLSYAVVEITTAGEADSYDAGTEIIGPMKHDNDYDVVGYLMDDVSWTANDTTAILRIQYAPMEAEDNERYLECYVGGLWMFNGEGQATLGGCKYSGRLTVLPCMSDFSLTLVRVQASTIRALWVFSTRQPLNPMDGSFPMFTLTTASARPT